MKNRIGWRGALALLVSFGTTGCSFEMWSDLNEDLEEAGEYELAEKVEETGVIDALDGVEVGELPETISVGGIEVEIDVSLALSLLFPKLSKAEIDHFSVGLSIEDLAILQAELEEARSLAVELTADLADLSLNMMPKRKATFVELGKEFEETLQIYGQACHFDESQGLAEVFLSGAFLGEASVDISLAQMSVLVDGQQQEGQLSCLRTDESVDIVFLVDVTGSMGGVIDSVRGSLVRFVDSIEESGVRGTVSVVSFQDSVGVNIPFQKVLKDRRVERSPFFPPVDLSQGTKVEELRAFVNRLEANRGADGPENLAGAIDFARNNVIGFDGSQPNVIDGDDDPSNTSPFVELKSDRQVFVALTDSTFHADNRDTSNSSLKAGFKPRPAEEILKTLQQSGTVVHVIDPSWVDESTYPGTSGKKVDADYWAEETGGLGEDVISGYSMVDLEVVVSSRDSGLMDVVLDGIISSTCHYQFESDLSGIEEVEIKVEIDGQIFTDFVSVLTM